MQLPSAKAVHVWHGSLDLSPEELSRVSALLNPDEQERAARFHFRNHQARFIAGRGLVRRILATYLDCDGATLEFDYSSFDKPALRFPGARELHFNVAHSEDGFLLGICEQPIGIDLERLRPISEIHLLPGQVFSPAEIEQWKRTDQSTEKFLGLWTRKEALLKGIGLGIADHVKDVSVFFDNEGEVTVPRELGAHEWTIKTFVESSWIWSVAVPFDSPDIRVFENAHYLISTAV